MILDKITALDFYGPLIPRYAQIAAFLNQSNYAALEPGRYDIEGSDAYVLIQHYQTSSEAEKKWESHRRYLDIQILLGGREHIGYSDIGGLTVVEPYRDDKDVALYSGTEQGVSILLEQGSFCIFYPRDGHKPGYHKDRPEAVVKAVVKVRL